MIEGDRVAEHHRDPVDPAVEPGEEALLRRRPVLQHERAHRRRQREGDEPREGDRDHDRDRELLVELPRRPRQERRRDEDRRHDEDDRDERGPDLLHRLQRGLPRRQVVLLHVPLDVLDDDDGVVDDHPDGQDDAEERQEVDREAERGHAAEGADERDEDRGRADDRRAEALEEEVDDEDDEEDRLEEGVDDLLDRDPHEVVVVEGDDVVDAVRHRLLQRLHRLPDALRDLEAVRAGLLVDGDQGGGRPVELVLVRVEPQADVRAGDVAELHDGAPVLAGAEDDLLVLGGLDEPGLGDDREGLLDLPLARAGADLPGPEEGVLVRDRALQVARRDPQRGHLVRVHPDPHRLVGRAEDRRVAGAVHPLDGVEDVDVRVVRDVVRLVSPVLVEEGDDHHHVRRLLLDRDPLALDEVGELRQREVHAVLDLDLRDVGVRVEREEDGDASAARCSSSSTSCRACCRRR